MVTKDEVSEKESDNDDEDFRLRFFRVCLLPLRRAFLVGSGFAERTSVEGTNAGAVALNAFLPFIIHSYGGPSCSSFSSLQERLSLNSYASSFFSSFP